MKNNKGITLVALVITVILLLILAAITISYSIGNKGIISNAQLAKRKEEISRIQEELELEKVNLVAEKGFNIKLTDYIEQIKKEKIITQDGVVDEWNVDYGSCYIKVKGEGEYYFKIEDDEKQSGNLQITYVEQMLLVSMEETIKGMTIQVSITPKEESGKVKQYEYYIKKKGETLEQKETNTTGQYTYTGLNTETTYWIEIKVIGEDKEEVRLGKWITIGKDEEAPTATITISGDNTQANLPIKLQATIKHEDEISGIKIGACKYVINQSSEEIGLDETKYTGDFTSEEETIDLELESTADWYLHVLTVDNADNKTETIKGPIKVEMGYHTHTGSSTSGGGCYTRIIYHTHSDACRVNVYCNDGPHEGTTNGQYREFFYGRCPNCGNQVSRNWSAGYNYCHSCAICGKTEKTVEGYGINCGKTEETVEGYHIEY